MNQDNSSLGVLYLIPTPLGDNSPLEVLPLSVKKIIEDHTHFIIENEKAARQFIKKITPNKNQDKIILYSLNKYTTQEEMETYLDPCKSGISMGLFSDAGCPGIADPGAVIVSKAHRLGITVKPLTGPSSLVLALMASGMNGQSFAFNGYLPIEHKQRNQSITKFENKAFREEQAQLFIETPYRSEALFKDFLKTLDPNTRLCVACELSLNTEYILTLSVKDWKKVKPQLNRRPCVFIIEGSF
ncbi:MAG: SAM-dependent methyltransferase [Flavobacteriaceae bacterium]|nr:SAM-dependent methyltransferase [Flavobacteriaceae bacterium]MDG2503243.1 SAM-dependent methyltransferase [Flavobacteriaceae bacterium]